jgi:hypothetical protein
MPLNNENLMDKSRDKIYSDAIRNHSFVPFWKAHLLKPKYDEPKGSNVLMILLYKDYPTLAKHNSFITGSNVFHLNNNKSSEEMKN